MAAAPTATHGRDPTPRRGCPECCGWSRRGDRIEVGRNGGSTHPDRRRRQGWPVGEVLGSQTELIARYKVSRAVFREAVRIVENQQVATMRRGPGGGLVVTEPTVDAIIDAAVLYLHRANTRLDEVFEARIVLEEVTAELAAERLAGEDAVVSEPWRRTKRPATSRTTAHSTRPRGHYPQPRTRALRRHPQQGRLPVLPWQRVFGLADATLTASQEAHARIIESVPAAMRAGRGGGCARTSKPSLRTCRTAACRASFSLDASCSAGVSATSGPRTWPGRSSRTLWRTTFRPERCWARKPS